MSKVAFFYANGTSYLFNVLEVGFSVDLQGKIRVGGSGASNLSFATVAGLDGKTAAWDGAPQNDPFPSLLDPDKWSVTRIKYPAAAFPMGASINMGITETIARINALPPGQPFALGGYSQGAAVMSGVYNEIRYGSLTSRASSFLGAIMFGNPRRQQNHRGMVGGTWSGSWDVPGSTVDGHGSFPTSGAWARLQNCADEWVEFTMPGDIFSSVGGSATGLNWTTANSAFLDLSKSGIIGYFANGMAGLIVDAVQDAFALSGVTNTFTDAAGKTIQIGGYGHTSYPFVPPEGDPYGGFTSYQVALAYLEALADEWATAPVALPASSAGWSTTLLPPAS